MSKSRAGEGNPHATLSDEQVLAIVAKLDEDPDKRGVKADLAREYGVSDGTIGDIDSGRRWSQITGRTNE